MSSLRKFFLAVLLLILTALFCFDFGRFAELQRFREGVTHYRQGGYKAAAERFATVTGGAALYNRGNCLVRMAEQAAGERELAGRYYDAAVDAYRAALLLQPGDGDMQHNLEVAMNARTGLERAGQEKRLPEKASGETAEGAATAKTGEPTAVGQAGQGEAANTDDQGRGALRKGAMTRNQAERLLADKRGSNLIPSASPAASRGRLSAPPLKDW